MTLSFEFVTQTPSFHTTFSANTSPTPAHLNPFQVFFLSFPPPLPYRPVLPTLLYRPPHPLPHARHRLMILRIRRKLHQEIHRLSIQLHVIPLEPQITHPRLLLLAPTPVILEEQRHRPRRIEQRPLHGDLLHLAGACDLHRLRRRLLCRGAKVEGIVVEEELQRFGRGFRLRGPDQDAVQADLPCERDDHEELLVGEGLQLGRWVEALGPGFLHDGEALVGFIFVEGAEAREVDLGVE